MRDISLEFIVVVEAERALAVLDFHDHLLEFLRQPRVGACLLSVGNQLALMSLDLGFALAIDDVPPNSRALLLELVFVEILILLEEMNCRVDVVDQPLCVRRALRAVVCRIEEVELLQSDSVGVGNLNTPRTIAPAMRA